MIKLFVDTLTGKRYDITEVTSELEWVTDSESQPGKAEFILSDTEVTLTNGDKVEIKNDGKTIFKGTVFINKKHEVNTWRIVAYDNLRYLKNEDTIVFNASSIDKRFETIMKTMNLPYKILDKSSYSCAAQVADTMTYFTMLKDAIDETLLKGNESFAIRDNDGVIELYNTKRMVTNLIIGDKSLLSKYEYSRSIDEETYNSVKVVKEDKDKNTREVYVVDDAKTIKKYGRLQIVEMITDAETNSAQMKEQASKLLAKHNKELKVLELTKVIGNMSIQAGNSVYLDISKLYQSGIGKNTVAKVLNCTHYLGKSHTMALEVGV